MQKNYCCRINRELLELDCLEMEEVLEFLVDNFAVSGKVTLVNDGIKELHVKLTEKIILYKLVVWEDFSEI